MSSSFSSVRSSPIPDLAFDSYRSISLREQTLVKRQHSNNAFDNPTHSTRQNKHEDYAANKASVQHHLMRMSTNPNDYVTVKGDTYALYPYSGETFLLWILLAVLTILVIVNATLTFVVCGALRLGGGMESIEFFPNLLKFFGETDLDDIYKRDGIIQGFGDTPMEISGEDEGGQAHFWVPEGSKPSITVDKHGINISQVNEFNVVSSSGEQIFTTSSPSLGLPTSGVKALQVNMARVNRITSGVNESLELSSTSFTYLTGGEGARMDGRFVNWDADRDIFLRSISGNIIISPGKDGIHIDTSAVPRVTESGVTRNSYTYSTQGKREPQYKLCICMPEGKLFRIEIPLNNHKLLGNNKIGCHSANNPC
jgi:beta-sarcoglycan